MSENKIKVSAIHAFSDNYIWAVGARDSDNIALVDPGDAQVCIDYIVQNKLTLTAILVTHHHRDHVGGIKQLRQFCQQQGWPVTIYGPAGENIGHCDVKLRENEQITLIDLGVSFSVIDLPGHTAGHIAYANQDLVFCGDTLFSGGCGRIFEGTPAQMQQSLDKLSALPDSTLVYCAHEYTSANLNFAIEVEPDNADLHDYRQHVSVIRAQNQSSIPTSIGLEKKINPFLRCDQSTIKQSATRFSQRQVSSRLETLTSIRLWKDQF